MVGGVLLASVVLFMAFSMQSMVSFFLYVYGLLCCFLCRVVCVVLLSLLAIKTIRHSNKLSEAFCVVGVATS